MKKIKFKQSVRKARWLLTITLLLTLGIEQVWAWGGMVQGCVRYEIPAGATTLCESDNTTGTTEIYTVSSFDIIGIWITNYSDNNNGDGTSITNAQIVWRLYDATHSSEGGKNFQIATTHGSQTTNNREDSWTGTITPTTNSGEYYFKYYFESWFGGTTYPDNQYLPGNESYDQIHYKLLPPNVSDYTVTPSGNIHGDGSSGNPYIVVPGNTLTLTLSGATQAHLDANSVAHYSVDGSSYGAENTTKTINNVTNTDAQSVTVYAKFYNSSADLNGDIKSKTIYYKADPHYNVTATYGAGGTSATPASATSTGQYEGRSISATAALGYYFTGWTVTSGSATFANSESASTTVYPTAAATIQANFSPIWYLKGEFNSWTESDPISLASATSGSVGLTTTTAKLSNKKFKIWNKETNTYYQIPNKAIDRAHPTPSGSWTIGGSDNDMKFTSDIITTYTFAITYSSNIPSGISVTYPPAYTVTFGQGTGYGTAVTASATSAGGSFSSGDYVAAGEDVTFTQSAATGYTFKEWNTQADGNGDQLGTGASLTLSSIGENKNVYAIYTPNTHTLRFNLNGGNSYSSHGSASESAGVVTMNVTYGQVLNELTLPYAIKNAYHFETWSTSDTYMYSGDVWKYYYSVVPRVHGWDAETNYVTKEGDNYVWRNTSANGTTIDLYAHYGAPYDPRVSFSPEQVVPEGDVTATVTFSEVMGVPEGVYKLCYKLTTATGVELQAQPTFSQNDEEFTASFKVPASPGEYSLGIKLYPGSSATWETADPIAYFNGNTTTPSCICSDNKFEVEEMNTVTVYYKSGSAELRPSTTAHATYSNPASITAPDIPGMQFANWTITGSARLNPGSVATNKTIQVQASGAGTATANYTQGSLFFKDTKGWGQVYIYFYNSTSYWYTCPSSDCSEGTGSNRNNANFISGPHAMTLLEGTDDVYYYDGTIPGTTAAIAFSKEKMGDMDKSKSESPGYEYFAGSEANPCNVVYVNHALNSSKPMIVPVGDGAIWNIKKARYYAHDIAPLLPDWGYDLRGDNDYIGWSPATDADKHKMVAPRLGDLSFSTDIYFDNVLDDKEWKIYNGNKGYGREDEQKLTYTSQTSNVLANHDASGYNLKIQTNIAGNYTFTLNFGTDCSEGTYTGAKVSDANGLMGHMTVKVTYPVELNDFRLVYTGGVKPHPGNVIKKRANGEDIVSMYVAAGESSSLKVQPCSAAAAGSVTWTALGSCSDPTYADGVNFATILSEGGPGTYNFTITQDENKVAKITKVEKYTGQFYIRTDCVNADKWNFWKSKSDHAMTYSDYSTTLKTDPFSHYYVNWVSGDNVIVKFCVANDYSYAITDTLDTDDVLTSGPNVTVSATNVRFMYNQATNTIKRAYTYGPQNNKYMLLRTKYITSEDGTNAHLYKSWTSASTYTLLGGTNISLDGVACDTMQFKDNGNWVYQADVYARPGAPIKLTGYFNGATQYFKGTSGTSYATTGDGADAEQLMDGTSDPQHMRITYDFKTNRMVTAWMPSENAVTGELAIHADIMLLRREQEGAHSVTFGSGGSLADVKTAYGVMEFTKDYLTDYSLSRYARNLYWISFPFNVNLSDVFGFGKYGEHWIIEYYDGKGRAEKGYWAESEPNWKFVTEEVKDEFVLKANEGYILALALSNMGEYSSVWENDKISSVYLYFPSASAIGNLANVDKVTVEMDTVGYKCKITRDSRNIKDSYWRCIGAPSFAQSTRTGLPTTVPANWDAKVPYVYTWNSTNNSLAITSSSRVDFLAMHSYLIQYPDDTMVWTDVTNVPAGVARRRVEGNEASFYEWNLNLMRNGEHQDHTYVRLSNDENVTDGYDFGNDLSKEFNSGSNIYTFVDDVEVAGNVKPIRTETTIVPVGVKIATTGEYTFSMPEGTNGVGVILVDNIAGTRTNLALEDYTVNLTQGNIDNRFMLEISPIVQSPTDIEQTSSDCKDGVRKVMVDGILYIVKDGKVFDAQGKRLQ